MKPYAVLLLLLTLSACEGSEAAIAALVAALGGGLAVLGLVSRKKGSQVSQELQRDILEEKAAREAAERNALAAAQKRETERLLSEVRKEAAQKGNSEEVERRLREVEENGGMSQELLEQIRKELDA